MRKRFIWSTLAVAALVSGCINLAKQPLFEENHPANPSAHSHASEPAMPYLMAATNLTALKLEDLPKVEAHQHGEHTEHGAHTTGGVTNQPPAQATTYTCPHHPEVKQNKPGECPKCGMKLEVKK